MCNNEWVPVVNTHDTNFMKIILSDIVKYLWPHFLLSLVLGAKQERVAISSSIKARKYTFQKV